MIVVTGASGSLGSALVARLRAGGHDPVVTDVDSMDVTDEGQVADVLGVCEADVVFHLAGAKHAPAGELDPWNVMLVNAVGTRNVLEHAGGARVVLASTCKAADPETAYGASKLIAERMVLNAGGSVARFYNVPETCGNVFELWRSLPASDPLPVTPCKRYFQSLESAVNLLLGVVGLPSGRYCVYPGQLRLMADVAAGLYPGRKQRQIPPRRGDRFAEPLHAAHEALFLVSGTISMAQIVSPHDLVVPSLVAA